MNKESLERTLKRAAKGSDFITLSEIMGVFGYATKYRIGQELCTGLAKFKSKYFIPDVAERILEMSEVK